MKIDKEKFKKEKLKAEGFYKNLVPVLCPYFQEKIIFNAKGLEHLKFKKKNSARNLEDQFIRLRLLYLAPQIIKSSKTIQGISGRKVFELLRINNRNEHKMVNAQYFEFIAVIDGIRARVVIKQIGDSPKYFWSIIPFWKMNKENGTRKIHNGNPEED
ncbi:MAG: hypothetical protein KAR54_01995 [Candidatus Pacebacteria bacterium]|nr:hypothetical protein [Candidatus Paceibacterota bacterium]